MLLLNRLSKSVEDRGRTIPVIQDVTLEVPERQFLCIVGPSGSGKSTLLRLMMGLTPPTSGTLYYHGLPLDGVNLRAAMVFQSFALLPWLTVQANVELGLRARDLPDEECRRRAAYYLDKVGLDGFKEAYPGELSGGMKQRAALARALAVEPDLLCMDEPFSGLDALTSANLREEVLGLWADLALPVHTVVMVTHIIEEAVLMADRVVVLTSRPGRIAADMPVTLPRPRNKRDPGFDEMVDSIFEKIV
ncbi:MAG: nitrate/sulfonate/bicarbonate ABC transporter ATP-binding protein [Candidatus Eisenbacteria bacterium RBG_16_71_46]|nr:MAG: nitrate/sulfonate/bicarbonate ABC transporter ATP-binding protein [Candidatus Eisenbacteria bacterium RBG_16_71_46]OGF25249.1 MAG: nitrate/sulfonate/bicarbonate ABC transporter ATP-binding protein [Candidatus Eisenbacteria bacterium RBG_19FT_COMBO_70_11]